jgi:hypothetical protein
MSTSCSSGALWADRDDVAAEHARNEREMLIAALEPTTPARIAPIRAIRATL